MSRSTFEIGAAEPLSVAEIAPISLFSSVKKVLSSMVFLPAREHSVTECEHSLNYLALLMCVHCRVYLNREFWADKVRLSVQAGPFPFQNKQFMN